MRNILFALLAATALTGLTATARADQFTGSNYADDMTGSEAARSGAFSAQLDQRSIQAQDADPTVPNSIRSHGRP